MGYFQFFSIFASLHLSLNKKYLILLNTVAYRPIPSLITEIGMFLPLAALAHE